MPKRPAAPATHTLGSTAFHCPVCRSKTTTVQAATVATFSVESAARQGICTETGRVWRCTPTATRCLVYGDLFPASPGCWVRLWPCTTRTTTALWRCRSGVCRAFRADSCANFRLQPTWHQSVSEMAAATKETRQLGPDWREEGRISVLQNFHLCSVVQEGPQIPRFGVLWFSERKPRRKLLLS